MREKFNIGDYVVHNGMYNSYGPETIFVVVGFDEHLDKVILTRLDKETIQYSTEYRKWYKNYMDGTVKVINENHIKKVTNEEVKENLKEKIENLYSKIDFLNEISRTL